MIQNCHINEASKTRSVSVFYSNFVPTTQSHILEISLSFSQNKKIEMKCFAFVIFFCFSACYAESIITTTLGNVETEQWSQENVFVSPSLFDVKTHSQHVSITFPSN